MKEFETDSIVLNKGLRRFKSTLNSKELEECFNLMPTEGGLRAHETIIDMNANNFSWGGMDKLDRPMETDTLTINVTSLVFLEVIDGVTVFYDGTSQGTTDSDGNIDIAGATVGIHDIVLTKTGYDDSDDDVIFNDFVIVEPRKEVTINVDDFITDGNLASVKVYVDGKYFGKTGVAGNVTCWLRPGVRVVRLMREGHLTTEDDLIINDYFTVT